MRTARTSGHDRDAERDLVGELARVVVGRVAPEELGLLEETEADYFRDPELVLRAGSRDEAVGFGLDVALLTPYVLVAGTAVVHFLVAVVSDAVHDEVRDELKPVIAGRVRRLLRRDDPAPAEHRKSEVQDRAPGVPWNRPGRYAGSPCSRPGSLGWTRRKPRCSQTRLLAPYW